MVYSGRMLCSPFFICGIIMNIRIILLLLFLHSSSCTAMDCCTPGALEDIINKIERFFITCINPDLLQIDQVKKQMPNTRRSPKNILEIADGEECCICMEAYNNKDSIISLPCKHLFCLTCMQKWTQKQLTCPYCRRDFDNLNKFTFICHLTYKKHHED